MKNLIFIFLLFSSFTYSQEIYTYKSGGRVYEKNRKLSKSEIENYFSHNPEIIKLYDTGKTKKTLGNCFLYGGILGLITTHIYKVNSTGVQSDGTIKNSKNNTMYFVCAGISLVSIPIKIGYSSKIKKAVQLMNEEIKNQNTGNITETSIIANENGIGLKITF